MKYIIDFDGVIFDTEHLKEVLSECGISQAERSEDVFKDIAERKPDFDFASLVFPNARKFLEEHRGDCIIVSSYKSISDTNNTDSQSEYAFQLAKIEASGVKELLEEQDLFLTAGSKMQALEEIKKQHSDVVFIDDRETYLREAQELGIKAVWMDRAAKGTIPNPEGVPTMLEFSRVENFAQFAELVNTWNEQKTETQA